MNFFEILFDRLIVAPIWLWDPEYARSFDYGYRYFNLVEGVLWCLLGGWLLVRYFRNRHSPLEILYALVFVAFGATDFREAYVLQGWLILLKGIILASILGLRYQILKRFYPQKRFV